MAISVPSYTATEFVCSIKPSGGDYTTLTSWEAANQCDLTSADTRVYAGAKTGTVTSTVILYRAGSAVSPSTTGTVVYATTTQILIKSISGGGTPQVNDLWQVDASNYFTITLTAKKNNETVTLATTIYGLP